MSRERMMELPKIIDKRGNLSFVEAGLHIPFFIKRVYWIYDIPGGQRRGGGHAFHTQHEVVIALSGSFDVALDNGKDKKVYSLNRSYQALYVPNMTWRKFDNFSTNAICLVLSSSAYDENDYIHNHREFRKALKLFDGKICSQMPMLDVSCSVSDQYHTVHDCHLIDLPVIKNRAGNITPVHGGDTVPFDINRVFYIYDIPNGVKRGMHAHKRCHEILVAASGSFEVELNDGVNKRTVLLNRPTYGLHIPPGVWATEKEYSSGVVCLALASDVYDSADYINSFAEFKKYRSDGNKAL